VAERDLEIEVMKEIAGKMYDPPRVCKDFYWGCGSSVCQNVSGLL